MKYRIWSKKSECYTHEPEYPGSSLHCTSNYYLDHNGNLVDFVTSIGGNQNDASKCDVEQEDYIIEEYTGLDDIKGTRIFEGDIVRQKIGRKYKYYPVTWECYGWYIDNFPLAMFDEDLLVVGNIHHPLKKIKK